MSYSGKYRDIARFGKILVEWGGVYMVDKDFSIVIEKSESPVVIKTKKGNLPLKLFVGDLDDRDAAYLNIYVDTLGHTAEKDWFYSTRSLIAGNLIKRLILSIAEFAIDEDGNYPSDVIDIVAPYATNIDSKTIKEIKKLDANAYGTIVYSRPKRTAVLNTSILDNEFLEKNHLRKKTIKVLQRMFMDLLGTEDPKEDYRYKATISGLQRTDAVLHIILKLSQNLNEFTMALLDIDLHPTEIEEHIQYLADYRKQCYWAATGELVSEQKANKDKKDSDNWLPSRHNIFDDRPSRSMFDDAPNADIFNNDMDDIFNEGNRPRQVLHPNDLFDMATAMHNNPFINPNDLVNNYNPNLMRRNGMFGDAPHRMPMHDNTSPFKPLPIRK